MRSYHNPDKFFKKMKKKPALQAVLDNIDNYTEDQINDLRGTHFPLWIREELIKYKNRNGNDAESIAEEIARKMNVAAALKRENNENN
jgi:hypothetical protein